MQRYFHRMFLHCTSVLKFITKTRCFSVLLKCFSQIQVTQDFQVVINIYLAVSTWDISVMEPNDIPTALPGTELSHTCQWRQLWSFHLTKMFLERWKKESFKQCWGKRVMWEWNVSHDKQNQNNKPNIRNEQSNRKKNKKYFEINKCILMEMPFIQPSAMGFSLRSPFKELFALSVHHCNIDPSMQWVILFAFSEKLQPPSLVTTALFL